MNLIKQIVLLIIFLGLITGCSDSAVKNADVVNTHGSIEGLDKMELFYEDTKKNVKSDLSVVHYTIEGDPMITDLTYNNGVIKVKQDTTRDQYGSGRVTTITCGRFYREVNPTNVSYVAADCKGTDLGMDEILNVDYDMKQQDLFEIQI